MKTLTTLSTTRMRAATFGLVLAATTAALPANAQERASRHENIGVATGLVVGAAAGGPVGAIFGAAAGAWLGDRYHRQSVERERLASELSISESQREELMQSMLALHDSLVRAEARSEQLARALEHASRLEADIGFRTGDSGLTPETRASLEKLGVLIAALPDTKVRVAGYADPRGPEEMNADLSRRRAEAVAAVLADAGVPADRLIVEAYGESASTSAEGDLDAYAFDRRVTVSIESTDGTTVAQAN